MTLFQSGTPFTVINTAGNTGISVTDNAGVSSGLGLPLLTPMSFTGGSRIRAEIHRALARSF